jgi:ABC-type transport system involved in multi-copper enzyme maturation permease subunit
MLAQLLAIFRNTFFESIRQPIMLVVLIVATIGIIASNSLATHTMGDDHKMMIDMGLATVFLAGTICAAFIATNVLSREIDNRTVLTVISKPVGRPLFIAGKYLGVAGAIALATTYMGFVFLLSELHGTLQTVRDPYHGPVLAFGLGAIVLATVVAVWCNYFYEMVFASTMLCVATPLIALAYFLSLMFKHDFTPQWIGEDFRGQIWLALSLILMAVMVLTALAVALSTRLGQVMTLTLTIGLFFLGMSSDWVFGRAAQGYERTWLQRAEAANQVEQREISRTITLVDGTSNTFSERISVATVPLTEFAEPLERVAHAAAWIGYAIVPNFQIFWLSDALTQRHVIPGAYVLLTHGYGLLLIAVALCLATILFQRREVG